MTDRMPDEHAWEKVVLTDEERKANGIEDARKRIDLREEPGSMDHAIAILRYHSQRRPDAADLHLLLAEAHSRAAEALNLEKPEERSPHLYHRTEGLRHADEALRLAPGSGPAHYWRGTNLLHFADGERSLGRAKEAISALDQADKICPEIDEGGPSRLRGRVLYEMPPLVGGSVSRAIANFKKSLQYGPNHPTTHLWLGEAYQYARQNELARKELEWVLNAKPRPHREKEDAGDRQKAQELLKKLEAK